MPSPTPRLRGSLDGTRVTVDASLTFLLTDAAPDQLYRAGIWGCCAARKFVTILQDGSVLPCSHVRRFDVGDGDFMRAWHESQVFAAWKRRCAGAALLAPTCPSAGAARRW
jgi:MoaA/NifB/PqqE/SkfB family radical SAM enzyme